MTDPFKFAFEFSKTPAARPRDPEQPMRILVLGNFGGHDPVPSANRLAGQKTQRVDIDNFDRLLASKRPTVRVPAGEGLEEQLEIPIHALDDFHPDHLYRNLPVFRELQDLRKRLSDPSTFDEAAGRHGPCPRGPA